MQLAVTLGLLISASPVMLLPSLHLLQKRRIAELMSQLPGELDVERMVVTALGGVVAAQAAAGAAGDGQQAAGAAADDAAGEGGAAGAAGGEDKESISHKKWRAIIK